MTSPSDAQTQELKEVLAKAQEASLTIHEGLQPGSFLFSLDLSIDDKPTDEITGFALCDLIAMTLLTIGRNQPDVFIETYRKVESCLAEIAIAMQRGALSQEINAIRERWGVHLRAH